MILKERHVYLLDINVPSSTAFVVGFLTFILLHWGVRKLQRQRVKATYYGAADEPGSKKYVT